MPQKNPQSQLQTEVAKENSVSFALLPRTAVSSSGSITAARALVWDCATASLLIAATQTTTDHAEAKLRASPFYPRRFQPFSPSPRRSQPKLSTYFMGCSSHRSPSSPEDQGRGETGPGCHSPTPSQGSCSFPSSFLLPLQS